MKHFIRLDLTEEEAHRMKKVLSQSTHPAKERLIQEIHEQERAIALAEKRPEVHELRPLGNQLIRDVAANLPETVGAILLLFDEKHTVYTAARIERYDARLSIMAMLDQWEKKGEG
jgi:hypothetical protein